MAELPAFLDHHQAIAWVSYRTAESVEYCSNHVSLQAARMYEKFPSIGAEGDLMQALLEDRLRPTGFDPERGWVEVQPVEWNRLRFGMEPGRYKPYVEFRFARSDMQKLWPAQKAVSSSPYDWDAIRAIYDQARVEMPEGTGTKAMAFELIARCEQHPDIKLVPTFSTFRNHIREWRG